MFFFLNKSSNSSIERDLFKMATNKYLSIADDSLTINDFLNLINNNNKLDSITEIVVILVFCIVIVCGFFGNILVICTVLTNKHMKTSGNLFTINLAISDLTLCVFSIPFMTYKALKHTWVFGTKTKK